MTDLNLRDPVRALSEQALTWASQLAVESIDKMPLPGATQQRTWDPDPRLVNLNSSVDRKNSDKVTYYEQVAILSHRTNGVWFVVFRETMDALLAQQKDPGKFPMWLMGSPVKKTELKTFIGVLNRPPSPRGESSLDYISSLDEAFGPAAASWMGDVISYTLLKKGVIKQEMYGKA